MIRKIFRCKKKCPMLVRLIAGGFILYLLFELSGHVLQKKEFDLSNQVTLLSENNSALSWPLPKEELDLNDFTKLIDITGFEFQMNNYPCDSSRPLLMLILIHSAPENVQLRQVIRESWGQRNDDYEVLFLLGKVNNPKIQKSLEEEETIYSDLVQGNFIDSYRNLTYKHAMALKWAIYYCPNYRYLLKTDDDVFVNTPALLDFVEQRLSPWGAQNLILCGKYYPFAYVQRDDTSKWKVTYEEYPGGLYPPYCAGWAVMYSRDVVFSLYKEAQLQKYFWVDDVHITGTLAAAANLTHTSLDPLVLSPEDAYYLLKYKYLINVDNFLLGSYNLQPEAIEELWQIALEKNAVAL
ncbi:hypothetical protein C0J52_05665 [Blattella germanica]|nr:hypothetical protein C0J52_05665 [Blattella germanica]